MIKRTIQQQTWLEEVRSNTLNSIGARFGVFWISILIFMATFAPLIANTRPLLVLKNGIWISPAVQAFTSADAAWVAGGFVFLCLVPFKLSIGKRVILVFLSAAIVLSASSVILNPPRITLYENFRSEAYTESADFVLKALVPYSPTDYQREHEDVSFDRPDTQHWLGTEENGASVLSRIIHASRIALGTGFIATGIALFIGIVIGGMMGYFAGLFDLIGMRLVEVFEAIPTLFFLLAFVAFFGSNLYVLMVIIGITSWPGYARYVRAEFLRLREQDFVQAAVVNSIPLRSILFRHMLPNALAPILVAMSFGFASAILAEATLSFLGLGLVDEPSWGQMLNQAVRSSNFIWWMALFPGGAIFLTVLSYNLIGEALRDAVDPHTSGHTS